MGMEKHTSSAALSDRSKGSGSAALLATASAAAARSAAALSPAQRTAIERLTSGYTMVDSALAAGVGRATLYRWLKSDPEFLAAYNAWQQDAVATARGRLLALTDSAVSAVGKAMGKGD